MMRSTTFFLLLFNLFLAACTNSNDADRPAEGTASEGVEEMEESGSLQAEELFPQLAQYLEAQDTSFRSGEFVLRESTVDTASPLLVRPLDTASLRPYRELLVYNNDRSKAIDLFSYGTMLVKKGDSTVLEGGEPDTEVAVVDFRNNTRRRIFYTGPSYSVLEGRWQGDTTVLLAVAEETGEGLIRPQILEIHLSDRSIDYYYFTDSLRASTSGYITQRYRVGR